MSRFLLVALVVVFLSVAGVALAGNSPSPSTAPAYGWVNPTPGGAPTFAAQDNMSSVRRVGTGHYCLASSTKFSGKVVAQLTTDLSLSHGKPGIAMLVADNTFCRKGEVAVATFQFVATGGLRLSNNIAFVADPEG